MPLITTLIGAVLGAWLGRGFDAVITGGFIGLIAGLVFNAWRKSRTAPQAIAGAVATAAFDPLALLDPRVAERIRAMERRIASLEAALRGAPAAGEAPLPVAPPTSAPAAPADAAMP